MFGQHELTSHPSLLLLPSFLLLLHPPLNTKLQSSDPAPKPMDSSPNPNHTHLKISTRYGNYSFRTWHRQMTENCESLMLKFLPDDLRSTTVELIPYFTDGFGNSTRIDYGTGHETNFAAWLYCLARIGVLIEEDYHAVVSRVFVERERFCLCFLV